MNKNLKKVISAVAALALSVTSFVAMASYPDVPETDQYASAINQLSAMGVIEGFEDGTFHPDELVTRAQMAAMVVRALNISNAESNKVQKFNDVPADNWAAGWVATAADNNIINGTGNGNFDPSLNVTYAQTAKMLVAAAGYDDWAISKGGWPSGYMLYAGQTGITAGISNVSNDTALTRAQCAQMIANALEAPMLDTVEVSMGINGYQELKNIFDGSTDERSPYKTLLSEKWNMYVVNGTVTATPKTDNTLKDKVTYEIKRAKNYNGESVGYSNIRPFSNANDKTAVMKVNGVLIGDTNAADYLNAYTRAVIAVDSYDEAAMIYIEGSTKSDEIALETNLYVANSYVDTVGSRSLQFTKSASTSTKTTYKLNDNWKLVVNGVTVANGGYSNGVGVTSAPADTAWMNYFLNKTNNPNQVVTLTDTPDGSTTDGKYDVISVDYPVTAVVDSVSTRSGKTTVQFKDQVSVVPSGRMATKLEVDLEDDTKTYSFTKGGEEVALEDLKENDVLSIKYNATDSFATSSFYTVEVSDATVEGKVTGLSTNSYGHQEYTIAGTAYVVATNMNVSPKIGSEYTVYLTADGKIAATEKLASTITYGIVERAYNANATGDTAMIIGKDGVKRTYEIDDNSTLNVTSWITAGAAATRYQGAGNDLKDRIVNYRITSSNTVRMDKDDLTVVADNAAEYQASTSRLGAYKIDDATVIIDMSDIYDYTDQSGSNGTATVYTKDALVDGTDYRIIVAKDTKDAASDPVPFVVVVDGLGGFSVDTQMAVVSKVSSTSADNINRDLLGLYINGEYTEVTTENANTGLGEGDVIIYTINSDGRAEDITTVFNTTYSPKNTVNFTNRYNYLSAIANVTGATNEAIAKAQAAKVINSALPVLTRDSKNVEYAFGPVLAKSSTDITLGIVKTGAVEKTTLLDTPANTTAYYALESGVNFAFDTDAKVYIFDGNANDTYRVDSGNGSSVIASAYAKASAANLSFIDNAGSKVNLGAQGENNATNAVAFALVRLYDNRVQEVYSIAMTDDEPDDCVWVNPQQ